MSSKVAQKKTSESEVEKLREEVESLQKTVETLVAKKFTDSIAGKKEAEPQKKSNKKLFIIGGIILGTIVIAAASLFVVSSTQVGQGPIETTKSAALPIPTVTPKPILVKSEWSFEVLNGSGVAGAAKEIADRLTSRGYLVIGTDNADRQTYQGNGLFVSSAMESKTDLLIADLKDVVEIATVAGVLRDSTASARIIVGK